MRRTAIAFVLSVIIHPLAVAVVLGVSWLTRTERPPRIEQRPVSLRPMSTAQWEKNRGPPPKFEPMPTGQVVDVAPGNLVRPKETKYLAETDNSIPKQTRAKEQTNKWKRAAPKTQPAPAPVSLASRLETLNNLEGARPRLGALLDPQPSVEANDTPATSGGAAPNDDLHDVETGDGTYLNTREWKFAGFMNRVKQAVSAKWDPNGRLKQKEPNRQLFAPRNTVLAVTLRPDGTLADVYVLKPCGIDSLDQEAVAAFERAAPFVNPPEALVENGYIRFQFGFTLTYENGFMPAMAPGRLR